MLQDHERQINAEEAEIRGVAEDIIDHKVTPCGYEQFYTSPRLLAFQEGRRKRELENTLTKAKNSYNLDASLQLLPPSEDLVMAQEAEQAANDEYAAAQEEADIARKAAEEVRVEAAQTLGSLRDRVLTSAGIQQYAKAANLEKQTQLEARSRHLMGQREQADEEAARRGAELQKSAASEYMNLPHAQAATHSQAEKGNRGPPGKATRGGVYHSRDKELPGGEGDMHSQAAPQSNKPVARAAVAPVSLAHQRRNVVLNPPKSAKQTSRPASARSTGGEQPVSVVVGPMELRDVSKSAELLAALRAVRDGALSEGRVSEYDVYVTNTDGVVCNDKSNPKLRKAGPFFLREIYPSKAAQGAHGKDSQALAGFRTAKQALADFKNPDRAVDIPRATVTEGKVVSEEEFLATAKSANM